VTASLKEAVLITPDARMNSLIVSGPVDYMGLIEQIITRLDNSSPQQAKIRSSRSSTPTRATWPSC